jgi:hypothetical protein
MTGWVNLDVSTEAAVHAFPQVPQSGRGIAEHLMGHIADDRLSAWVDVDMFNQRSVQKIESALTGTGTHRPACLRDPSS